VRSSVSDIARGRLGDRWVGRHPGRLLAEIRAIIAQARANGWERPDLSLLFHPETVAATHAHRRDCGGRTHPPGEECPARPDPADVADTWAGRARMAAARLAAGRLLDDLDRQALTRLDDLGADPR
jgi:hypothetical protein